MNRATGSGAEPEVMQAMNRLDEVLEDLMAEGAALDAAVANLAESGWRSATPAVGWDVATQLAHLAWTDEASLAAATSSSDWDRLVREAATDVSEFVDEAALAGSRFPARELLERWRTSRSALAVGLRDVPGGCKIAWFGPPMSATSMATARVMETWAQAIDVYEAIGVEPPLTDRVRHVALLGSITRAFAFRTHGLAAPEEPVFVSLTLPSGLVWTHGSPDATNVVTGSAYDFALFVTQRRHRNDLDLQARGQLADRWLTIAQAFAGPPGTGRVASRTDA
jgi:uncharacterized protein (TIGR03084 family)